MKLSYSDPPYPGQAKRHFSNDPSGIVAEEVDHYELLKKLRDGYDGWALSTSTPALPMLYDMIGDLFPPNTVRTAAWVKPFASWKPTHRVQYTWEPVLFIPVRPKGSRLVPSVRDYVSANITMRKGTHGAKPDTFCNWIIDLIGWQPGDTFEDMFPGSGAFTRAIEKRMLEVVV
jgi:hypothetical protein